MSNKVLKFFKIFPGILKSLADVLPSSAQSDYQKPGINYLIFRYSYKSRDRVGWKSRQSEDELNKTESIIVYKKSMVVTLLKDELRNSKVCDNT